jgi:SAM-dependent methyltransferase
MALSNNREEIVLIPAGRIGHVLWEFIRGIRRLLQQHGLPLDEEKAMEYFRRRSLSSDFEDFTDSSRDWYLSILKKSCLLTEKINQRNRLVVLDIGCGRGGLLNWFLSNSVNTNYFGIDQDRAAINFCRERFDSSASFIEGDVRMLTTSFNLPSDLIFAVNVFPYISNPGGVLADCKILAANANSLLVILDPNPTPYWDKEFGGFGIELREAAALERYARSAGWRLCEQLRLAVASIFGVPVLTLSNLLVFNPE